MHLAKRAALLAQHCQKFTQYLGEFSVQDLLAWVQYELGDSHALDAFFSPVEGYATKAIASPIILHIASNNSPHNILQSLLRGLLVGSHNIVKLPSADFPVVDDFIHQLPTELTSLVSSIAELDDASFASASTVIAFGNDDTMLEIQKRIAPHQRFIPHGHKLSIGIIAKPTQEAALLAARDIGQFNQRGCLSLQTIYVIEGAKEFAALLAEEMRKFEATHPRGNISMSESGAISNLRNTLLFQQANDPENVHVYQSGTHANPNTHWTVIYQNSPTLQTSPLNRTAFVQPLPQDLNLLGKEAAHLSTVALYPKQTFTNNLTSLAALPCSRFCSLGESQQPKLFWHHDGIAPLASLVTWIDLH